MERVEPPAIAWMSRILAWLALLLLIVVILGWGIAERCQIQYWNPSTRTDGLTLYLYQRLDEAADVLFLGSSRTQQSIDPVAIEALLDRPGRRAVRVYNLAQQSASIVTQDLILRSLVTRERKPSLIVLEVGVGSLNSNCPEVGRCLEDYATPADLIRLHPAIRSVADIEKALTGLFRGARSTVRRVVSGPGDPQHREKLDERRRGKGMVLPDPQRFASSLASFPMEFREEYRRKFVRSVRRGRLKRYRIEGVADQALRRAIAFARGLDIEAVLLHMPTAPEYDEALQRGEDEQYWSYMRALVAELNVPFLEPGAGFIEVGDHEFRDLSHLNERGSRILERHLVEHLLAPHLGR